MICWFPILGTAFKSYVGYVICQQPVLRRSTKVRLVFIEVGRGLSQRLAICFHVRGLRTTVVLISDWTLISAFHCGKTRTLRANIYPL